MKRKKNRRARKEKKEVIATLQQLSMNKYTSIIILSIVLAVLSLPQKTQSMQEQNGIWDFQSVDTMKYSRDLARQEVTQPAFDATIDQQMTQISQTGATYVAIGTPYDDEFLPMLKRWVTSARAHHLHVWFRGNFSGWEGWFGYAKIDRSAHLHMTKQFILENGDLFADGDVFTACPECENGGPGDPRQTGDVSGFRQFMIDEYTTEQDAFSQIHKTVATNYDSMNGDVARLIMDPATTKAIGGIVTIDHYVKDGTQMAKDVQELAAKSGGKIVIGEFGAPIPDIHGDMTDGQQADWLADALTKLANTGQVVGVNYWTSVGGSTQLWDGSGTAKPAVTKLTLAYTFHKLAGVVTDELHHPISQVAITIGAQTMQTDNTGSFTLPYLIGTQEVTFHKEGFQNSTVSLTNASTSPNIVLKKAGFDLIFFFQKLFAH